MTRARELSSAALRVRGLIAVAVIGVVIAVFVVDPFSGGGDGERFDVVAPTVPDGIRVGVPVDIRGETVGEVCELDISQQDSTRVGICLRKSAMGELTDHTAVSFVSRNVFGSDALRLTPTGAGARLSSGATIRLDESPADHTITATVRSAGGFTLPVLTPRLSELLKQVSETTVRMSPFLTAATVVLQTADRGDLPALLAHLPQMPDVVDGAGDAGAGALSALETIIGNRLLADGVYTAKVSSMIADIGGLFGDLGALFSGMAGLGSTMDLMTAFTTPLGHALRDVTPAQVAALVDHAGGVFHRDPKTGKTMLRVDVDLAVVPGVASPLNHLIGGGGR